MLFRSYDEPNGSAAYYVYYRADYEDGVKTYIHPQKDDCGEEIVCDLPKWKPSIHMPKDAARIFLKVTNVRVERLKEITYEGCISEGITDDYKTYSEEYHDNLARRAYPVIFSDLWNSTINKQDLDEYGWEANPYVWVIEFERVEVEV